MLLLAHLFLTLFSSVARAGFLQGSEGLYLAKFDQLISASYAAVDENQQLIGQCGSQLPISDRQVTIAASGPVIKSSEIPIQCHQDDVCTLPPGVTLQVDVSLNVGALIVKGKVEWNDASVGGNSVHLCAGYVAVEEDGFFEMELEASQGWVYIKNNGAVHSKLGTRTFGAAGDENTEPRIEITGRHMERSWTLLAKPFLEGETRFEVMHDPSLMGWQAGDRIGVAPTKRHAEGEGQSFTILALEPNAIVVDQPASDHHKADIRSEPKIGAVLMSAEVVNLSRNIVITGDDFEHVQCTPNLPEAVPGEQTSTEGCRCAGFRNTCTIGLHTTHMFSGVSRIQNVRVEKCGQRGVEGKYCLHFHKLKDCPECLFKGNAIENAHQRGIIIHGTHRSTVEANVLWGVRGAGIYVEDANEMWNRIMYNVFVCPWKLDDPTYHGCTVPGTSNREGDTRINHPGIYSLAATNDLIGNRVANTMNGMFLQAGGIGRGSAQGKVCTSDEEFGRWEGNVFHGHKRFGTYTLGSNYPKHTDQSIATNGYNIDQSLCEGFDSNGEDTGLPAIIRRNIDYDNVFVGHYNAGDIQYNGHFSHDNNNLIYWKETKNFADGCSAHIIDSSYANGNMALPDQATFLIEDTTFGQDVVLEANHHCNVGITGVLCMPQYVLHNVHWQNKASTRWVWFQSQSFQHHPADQNHGGIFVLSPDSSMDGENSFFPAGFVSLVSSSFQYLLDIPGNICVPSSSLGNEMGVRYDQGILCTVPLRPLKIYSRDLTSGTGPNLVVEYWSYDVSLSGGALDAEASQEIGFHQIGRDGETKKQGYSVPVIPGLDHSYRISLKTDDGMIPEDWVIEFSDLIIGNRWQVEYLSIVIQGRDCGPDGRLSSHHDRRFLWSGDAFIDDLAWGNHGACSGAPDVDIKDCSSGVVTSTSYEATLPDDHLCDAARCGPHGVCAARNLGGSNLPVTNFELACVCEDGWSGRLCDFDPCTVEGRQCSGHGTCVASGDSGTKCLCDPGFSGEDCELTCNGFCIGSFPYMCATHIDGISSYHCDQNGGCQYSASADTPTPSGFCTFKKDVPDEWCKCESGSACTISGPCNSMDQCPDPLPLANGTPCNSVPWGVCSEGVCVQSTDGPNHVLPPTKAPTLHPSKLPVEDEIILAPPLDVELCAGYCDGEYPFGCFDDLANTASYRCAPGGSCFYTHDVGAVSPPGGYCIFKEVDLPTNAPSKAPSGSPTKAPTIAPSPVLSSFPSRFSSVSPSITPSRRPTKVTTTADDLSLADCTGVCQGDYPFGCATDVANGVSYRCHPDGGCFYGDSLDVPSPYSGFCTFKVTGGPAPTSHQAPTSAPTNLDEFAQRDCTGMCTGQYPFGCSEDVPNVSSYRCHQDGGCYYTEDLQDPSPYGGFCTYKTTESPATGSPDEYRERDCSGTCQGSFPFGCAVDVAGTSSYRCHTDGGCFYSEDPTEPSPYDGFCTFKSTITDQGNSATDCSGVCQGDYPFGCNDGLGEVKSFRCHPDGGCFYGMNYSDPSPSDGYCVFKVN